MRLREGWGTRTLSAAQGWATRQIVNQVANEDAANSTLYGTQFRSGDLRPGEDVPLLPPGQLRAQRLLPKSRNRLYFE